MRVLLSLLVLILATSICHAQEFITVKTRDGSTVVVTLANTSLKMATKYGDLTIPVADVRRVTIAERVDADALIAAIKDLGSADYRVRGSAYETILAMGPATRPSVWRASKSKDTEVAVAAGKLLEKLGPEVPVHDELVTVHGDTYRGLLMGDLNVTNTHFGRATLKFGSVKAVEISRQYTASVEIDAAANPTNAKWLDSGFFVNGRYRVQANGMVDLWPQGPGQYCCGPKGYTTPGQGSIFQAGALLGRIGETGTPFMLGEEYHGDASGVLYLSIVQAPWPNASVGAYRVNVSTK
jgi:hypothetical protein